MSFSQLVTKQHEELMRVRDGKNEGNLLCRNVKGDSGKDMLMLADTEDGFTVIQLFGNFTLQDIRKLPKTWINKIKR